MKILLVKIFFVFLSLTSWEISGENIGCRDENGNLVDWYYAYKLPNKTKSFEPEGGSGLHYVYVTSESESTNWDLSEISVNSTDSLMGQTLNPIYENSDLLVIMYSDQPPDDKYYREERGHTKGVVVANEKGGFWLVHSVPRFPPNFNKMDAYKYPRTGIKFGQSFLCISFKSNQIDYVGTQLKYNEPNIFAKRVPGKLASKYPKLAKASNMDTIKRPPYHSIISLQSSGGVNFTSFAKAGKFQKELYEDLVAPTLNDDLFVEGWRNGGGNIDTDCSEKTKVYNIKSIKLRDLKVDFKTTSDHSKWQVTSSDEDWVCVGDINRQQHQKVRGGGTVCQESSEIAKLYRDTIKDLEPCPIPRNRENKRRYKRY